MSNEKRTKSTATVLVTLEVDLDGVWGSDCTIDQVLKQARREGEELVRKIVGAERRVRAISVTTVRANVAEYMER